MAAPLAGRRGQALAVLTVLRMVVAAVTPLAPDLSLMTSEEESEMWLKGGESVRSRLVFTMIWKKERDGWKIVHSHESWVDEGPN